MKTENRIRVIDDRHAPSYCKGAEGVILRELIRGVLVVRFDSGEFEPTDGDEWAVPAHRMERVE